MRAGDRPHRDPAKRARSPPQSRGRRGLFRGLPACAEECDPTPHTTSTAASARTPVAAARRPAMPSSRTEPVSGVTEEEHPAPGLPSARSSAREGSEIRDPRRVAAQRQAGRDQRQPADGAAVGSQHLVDRPIQVGSHSHFLRGEPRPRLRPRRGARHAPRRPLGSVDPRRGGDERDVNLVEVGGSRRVASASTPGRRRTHATVDGRAGPRPASCRPALPARRPARLITRDLGGGHGAHDAIPISSRRAAG